VSNQDKYRLLEKKRQQALLGGGKERIDAQHKKGKLTARERIDILMDEGTFQELDALVEHRCHYMGMEKNRIPGDGVVTGYGKIGGRLTFIYAQDFTTFGGSLSKANSEKINKVMDLAIRQGAPVVGLNDSGGARIQEGVDSLAGYAEFFLRNVLASGVVPQITAVMGPCAGGAVYSPALTDITLMVEETSYMFLTGPDVVKTVLAEEVSYEELGGAGVHASVTGIAHFSCQDDVECLQTVRKLLSYLPQNNMEDPPILKSEDDPQRMDKELDEVVPDSPTKPYDVREIISRIVDKDSFLEIHADYAQSMVVGFARFDGRVVGIIANQPAVLAGCLDCDSSIKGARLIRFCDAFNIPVLTLTDVPGFLPGTDQEHRGVIKQGAKFLYAYCECTVPKINIITRKAYGGAYAVMSNRHHRGDIVYAWPTAEIAVMGAQGAVNVLYRKELAKAKEPEKLRRKLVDEFTDKFCNPYIAAELGYVDEVIMPHQSRPMVIKALRMLEGKRDYNPPKKHGNPPL